MIDLLVDRLRWPASLVRERAATQIARLIAEGRQDVSDALLAWIGRQELESRVAIGVLPFLKARELTGGQPVSPQDLAAACRTESVLADLFMSHYEPQYAITKTQTRHSGNPPVGWNAPNQHRGKTARGPEESLSQRLRNLEANFGLSLTAQFTFELAMLRKLHGESPEHALRFAGTREDGFHPAWHTLTDEIATSAYLRTLAWAQSNYGMPQEYVWDLAAFIAPVDLGLWEVAQTNKPEWWPDFDTDPIPESIEAQIAAVVEKAKDAANAWESEDDVVLAANGCIFQSGLVHHELTIRSFFQTAHGPLRPSTEEILESTCRCRAWVNQKSSPIRFEGPVSIDEKIIRAGDWLIMPCSGTTHPTAVMSWQAWRGVREIQCPTDALSNEEIHAVCHRDSVEYESAEGIIATWRDWSSNLSAMSMMGVPPDTGWVLTAPRRVVDRLSRQAGTELCWVWEVKSLFRDSRYEVAKEYRHQGERGTSALAIP